MTLSQAISGIKSLVLSLAAGPRVPHGSSMRTALDSESGDGPSGCHTYVLAAADPARRAV